MQWPDSNKQRSPFCRGEIDSKSQEREIFFDSASAAAAAVTREEDGNENKFKYTSLIFLSNPVLFLKDPTSKFSFLISPFFCSFHPGFAFGGLV